MFDVGISSLNHCSRSLFSIIGLLPLRTDAVVGRCKIENCQLRIMIKRGH